MIDIVNSIQGYTPHFFNIDSSSLLTSQANMLKAVSENNRIADEKYREIRDSYEAMDINEADKYLIDEEMQRLNQIMEDNSDPLGHGSAISSLRRYGIFDNPKFKQAIINQQRFREAEKSINDRTDLTNDQKAYYKSKIEYNGVNDEDAIISKSGNIVGYKEWENNINPVQQIDNSQLIDIMMKIAREDSRSKTTEEYELVPDKEGNISYQHIGTTGVLLKLLLKNFGWL